MLSFIQGVALNRGVDLSLKGATESIADEHKLLKQTTRSLVWEGNVTAELS